MKKVVSIVLAVMLLTTGCSFIGQKDTNDSESIIPKSVSQQTGNDENIVANASVNGSTPSSINAATTVSNSTSDALSISSSVNSDITGDVLSSGSVIDNGVGKGVETNLTNKNNVLITLYYRDKAGTLVPVTRSVIKQEGLAKAAIGGLVDEAVTREQLDYYGLYPVLPQGTKIKGMTVKNGSAVVDFSKEFVNLATQQDEQMAVASVVYTLTGFNTISNVTIKVEGKTVDKLKNGTELSNMRNRNNTFINAEETQLKEGYVKCDLYYTTYGSNNFNYFVPVSTQIEKVEDNQLPILMFDELSKTPSGSKYFTSFPQGTKLLSCDLKSNLVTLDFSSQIINYGGNEKENSLLNQIYYTVNQLKGIQKVKILIDGKEATMPEGTEVAVSKNLPTTFNKVMEK
ncbi:MAG TPA: GerMN domain-containing protein [Ruminiclostridium sp.]